MTTFTLTVQCDVLKCDFYKELALGGSVWPGLELDRLSQELEEHREIHSTSQEV